LLGIFFILLAFLTIFTTITNSLSFSTQRTIAIILIPVFLLLFLFVFFKKEWLYSDIYFWILFSLSLFIFSKLFFLQASFEETEGLLQYSYIINFFGYLALTIGFGNELYNILSKKKGVKKSKKK
jgi:O-antigen ligase